MSGPIIFLDVNIPMYAAGVDHPLKAPCMWVMQELAEGRLAAAIDTEIIQEILYRYSAIQKWDTAVTMATSLLELVTTVFPIMPEDAWTTIELYKKYAPQGLNARDILHSAIMRDNGLSIILSVDEHFDRIEGLTRVDPRGLYRERKD